MNLSLVFGRGSTGLNTVGPSSRLSASSSYSKGWYVDKPSLFPTPGGELLWRVSRPPRNFRLATSPAETCENRRLPGTTTTVRSSMVLVLNESKATSECITLVILWSCPSRHSLVGCSAQTNIARSSGTCQSGSPPGFGNKQALSMCQTFEDEGLQLRARRS